jgi:DHA3 family multidrug efflux protein-like MFS transporter
VPLDDDLEAGTAVPPDPAAPHVEAHLPPGVVRGPETMRAFRAVLVNTLVANVTSSYLWFALTFWAYLETRSVMATSIIGGGFMLFTAVFGAFFGTLVDHHRKKRVMVTSSTITLVAYGLAGALWLLLGETRLADWGSAWFWLFAAVILVGGVVESLRNIALSTTVTLLVPEDGRDKANGLVGTVQGIAFMITSVFSGLSVGILGMGWTLAVALALTGVALLHLLPIAIPELDPEPEEGVSRFDVRGAVTAVRAVPGLVALILFSTFNNLVNGVYIALMDPYGLALFSVEAWGIVLGVTGLGFVVGGGLVARFGLGSNPVRTLLLVNLGIAALGMTFTIREWAWLYVLGIFVFMCIIPAAESAEQTILQRVVPFRTQGRVFGLAQSVELAASPVSAFLIGPIAEFWLIPYMDSTEGRATWSWLLGSGEARGIALVFLGAGIIMLVTVVLALASAPYRRLSRAYADAPPQQLETAATD